MDKKIVSIIVTYNRLLLLKECINALLSSNVKCDILVVNNNSSDGTKEYLSSQNSIITYNLQENIGGAGGFNFGINEAIKLGYDYVWLMDDDTIVQKDSLSELMKVETELTRDGKDYAFLASKVLWTDGNISKMNVQRVGICRKNTDYVSHIVPVYFSSFVSCFIKMEKIKKFGLPIKEFFICTDDLEYTRRLTDKGKVPGYLCNNSVVVHKCKNNVGSTLIAADESRIDRCKLIYRNEVYCFGREGMIGHIYMLFRNIYHTMLIILKSPDKKMERIKILWKGYKDGFSFAKDLKNRY